MLVIAEAGVNHNGHVNLAEDLVDASRAAGADMVKFQTFRTLALVTSDAGRADYQARAIGGGSQAEMLRKLELSERDFVRVADRCRAQGITFLSTPFDKESASFLVRTIGVERIKIGSGDMDNLPLLVHVGRLGVGVILSTGMASLGEVETSLGALAFGYVAAADDKPSHAAFRAAYSSVEGRAALLANVVLLHCTTEYPAPFDSLNLNAIASMRAAFGLPVGFSDHSEGFEAAVASVALGATVLEKHVTLDRSMEGPDHKASLDPEGFAAMMRAIRNVERAMGDGVKRPMAAELANVAIARKCVVASRAIAAGEVLSEDNLTLKRAKSGLPAASFYDLVGRPASRAFAADEAVS